MFVYELGVCRFKFRCSHSEIFIVDMFYIFDVHVYMLLHVPTYWDGAAEAAAIGIL